MEGSALEGEAWQLEADVNGFRPWNLFWWLLHDKENNALCGRRMFTSV